MTILSICTIILSTTIPLEIWQKLVSGRETGIAAFWLVLISIISAIFGSNIETPGLHVLISTMITMIIYDRLMATIRKSLSQK